MFEKKTVEISLWNTRTCRTMLGKQSFGEEMWEHHFGKTISKKTTCGKKDCGDGRDRCGKAMFGSLAIFSSRQCSLGCMTQCTPITAQMGAAIFPWPPIAHEAAFFFLSTGSIVPSKLFMLPLCFFLYALMATSKSSSLLLAKAMDSSRSCSDMLLSIFFISSKKIQS